jgi:L-cysteine S-thiosulfotransferase
MKKIHLSLLAAGFFAIIVASTATAQQKSSQDAIADYRASLQDGNPADLNAARGEPSAALKT